MGCIAEGRSIIAAVTATQNTTDTALVLTDAVFGYAGRPVLTDITATVRPGDAVALIGPNGSGKSTLLNGILGLNDHLSGSVTVLGTSPRAARAHVGLLPQASQRQESLPVTVRQVVEMGLYRSLGAVRPMSRAQRDRVREVIEYVGLTAHARKRFGDLSGGMQQRAILARALVSDPKLLLLDEPFNGLDRPNREALLRQISALRENGVAVLVSTHDLEIAREACTHVMLLDHRMVAFGTLDEALTLENVAETFHDTTVEIDSHGLTTRREALPGEVSHHVHHDHPKGNYPPPVGTQKGEQPS